MGRRGHQLMPDPRSYEIALLRQLRHRKTLARQCRPFRELLCSSSALGSQDESGVSDASVVENLRIMGNQLAVCVVYDLVECF